MTLETTLYNKLYAELSPNYADYPMDSEPLFMRKWQKVSIGTMPPSPGVNMYKLYYEYDAYSNTVGYMTEVDWAPFVMQMARELPEWQLLHRSRMVAVASSPLRANEMGHRLAVYKELKPALRKYAMPERLGSDIYVMVLQKVLKSMSYSYSYIQSYIRDHAESHIAPGVSWESLAELSTTDWKDIYDRVRYLIELQLTMEGKYNNVMFNTGIRARPTPMPHVPNSETESYSTTVTRSRIVAYKADRSSWWAFIPDKTTMVHDIMAEAATMMGNSVETRTGVVDGGKVYGYMSDWAMDGYRFYAYDARAYDACVATILGPSFRPYWFTYSGVDQLPSGISLTSLLETIATQYLNTLWVNKYLMNTENVKIAAQGDDDNVFIKQGDPLLPKALYLDEGDTKYQFSLGFSRAVDPEYPRICGLKISGDAGAKTIPLKVGEEGEDIEGYSASIAISGNRDPVTRLVWSLLYRGVDINGESILRRLSSLPVMEYVSPAEIRGQILETMTKQVSRSELFEIAASAGINTAVYVG